MLRHNHTSIKTGSLVNKGATSRSIACMILFFSILLVAAFPSASSYANENSTNIIATAPDNPTRLTASAGDGSVDLNWVAPVVVGGSPITGYIVEVFDGVSTGVATVERLGDATQTSARVIGLTNGVSYTFRVSAVNASGAGAVSTGVTKTPVNTAGTGVTWTSHLGAGSNAWLSVAYGNGTFVAVGTGSGSKVKTSTDGINWTNPTYPVENTWRSVTYGGGQFVAVAFSGTTQRVMTSPNGTDWTIQPVTNSVEWVSVAYGNGKYVAVGTGNQVMSSSNGIAWTLHTAAADNEWRSVTYGNGLFVAVARTGAGDLVMTSPDGETWTSHAAANANEWSSVTYGNGLFVAVANAGNNNRVMTSTNGTSWTSQTPAADLSWNSVTYGNGVFVAVASSGSNNRVMTSTNGIDWTSQVPADNITWNSVVYGDGVFVAVSSTGTNRVMRSVNPAPFTSTELTASAGAASVDLNWVAPENNGGSPITSYDVQRSTNGISWVAATVAPPLGAVAPTSARVTGLTNGTPYFFRVRAVNANGPCRGVEQRAPRPSLPQGRG
jgi:hypothetical protein